jgi:hypothetical protein
MNPEETSFTVTVTASPHPLPQLPSVIIHAEPENDKMDSIFKDQPWPGSLPHVRGAFSLNSTQARHSHGLNVGLCVSCLVRDVSQLETVCRTC